jgi:hypothetical protein
MSAQYANVSRAEQAPRFSAGISAGTTALCCAGEKRFMFALHRCTANHDGLALLSQAQGEGIMRVIKEWTPYP